ncbi:MAG: aminotransferase class I/II-fold pyridoxal phosphate-dependent enzyme [Epsilonproteobacteria bacterium]|nr:aminotransferase class I/II-fold pyridoxal phosphate-dependent enzyme [Campylobacterota bacterium]
MSKRRKSIVRRSKTPNSPGAPLSTPLSTSVMYHFQSIEQQISVMDKEVQGFTYARYANPNSTILADKLSWLEDAKGGILTASGMAALSCVFLALLEKGDTIAASSQLYGQSLKMLTKMLPRMGFETKFFNSSDPSTFDEAITSKTKIIFVEIVSNPVLRLTYFKELVEVAKKSSAVILVDNTFSTPLGFKPLNHGATLVMQSVTKILSGHSDLNLGYIGTNDSKILKDIDELISNFGFNSSPFNSWLAERGLHTFELRFEKAQENAGKLAKILNNHPKIVKVNYPGLSSHPEHELAKEMLNGNFGTMVSFVLKGDYTNINNFVKAAKDIPYGPTLGDVATTMIVPSLSSHRHLSEEERLELGIEDTLVRISVGIESFDIIRDDLLDALQEA